MITKAESFYDKKDINKIPLSFNEKMIEFTKIHVVEALKQASEKAELYLFNNGWKQSKANIKEECCFNYKVAIDKETILSSYNIDLIL
jgi:predicted transcriptional regulator